MKNIQIIDGADNCCYDIYSINDEAFDLIFPNGQNIEFIEDLKKRVPEKDFNELFVGFWDNWVKKSEVNGIHGMLFYELYFKSPYYPTKKDEEMSQSQEARDASDKLRGF